MSEKSTVGLGTLTSTTQNTAGEESAWLTSQLQGFAATAALEQLAIEAADLELSALEDALAAITADEIKAAALALAAPAPVPPSLLLKLPSPFDFIEPPEIALPTITGSGTVTEGDQETQDAFAALKEASDTAASMGDAVFATLDPILQGLDPGLDGGVYSTADTAISDAGVEDDVTKPPLPAADVLPSIARMQLFDEIAYAFRRSGMAAGAEDPEAPGKILAAYIALAVEKFVRRAIIKVALPDDKVISLTADLNSFGTNTAAKSAEGILTTGKPELTPSTYVGGTGQLGTYDLESSDMMLGFNIVPQLMFYGGIETLKDYGDNFDTGTGTEVYRVDGTETKMMNLQAILMAMGNGINFI